MDSKIKSIANVVVAKGRGVGREKESVMLWTVAGGRSGWVLRIRAAGWSMSCSWSRRLSSYSSFLGAAGPS